MLRDGDGSMDVEARWCGVETDRGQDEQREKVHRQLKRIVKARGALDAQEGEALLEADRLGVWHWYGYGSLPEYMEMELGYTPRAAIERIRVAKAIVELPAIGEAMNQGELSFSTARELTRVATSENEGAWLEAVQDKNLRDIEQLVAGHKKGDGPDHPPDPTLRKRVLRYDEIDEETVALMRQARQILDRELGERLDNNQFLRALGRTVIDASSAATERRARTGTPYQIAVTTCDQCKRAWQDGGGITVEMSAAKRAAAECDAQHIGRVDSEIAPSATEQRARGKTTSSDANEARRAAPTQPSSAAGQASEAPPPQQPQARDETREAPQQPPHADDGTSAAPSPQPRQATDVTRETPQQPPHAAGATTEAPQPPGCAQPVGVRAMSGSRARTTIPPALRRKVNARDHGRCRVPWCRSWRNIDQHHIQPISEGGEHTLENLINLCESHHIALHEGALVLEGDATNARFTRRGHGAFEAATHATEAAKALRTLGFRKDEVNVAMEKTRTHVGTAQLTLEQWIRIALSYCPRPLG